MTETENLREVPFKEVAENPQEGDTILVYPGTPHEIKEVVIFVGEGVRRVFKFNKKGKFRGEYEKSGEIVKSLKTINGETFGYTCTRNQFNREIQRISSQHVDPVKCYRRA